MCVYGCVCMYMGWGERRVCVCVWVCACHGLHVEVVGQLSGNISLRPPFCGFQGWSSRLCTCTASICAEPSSRRLLIFQCSFLEFYFLISLSQSSSRSSTPHPHLSYAMYCLSPVLDAMQTPILASALLIAGHLITPHGALLCCSMHSVCVCYMCECMVCVVYMCEYVCVRICLICLSVM